MGYKRDAGVAGMGWWGVVGNVKWSDHKGRFRDLSGGREGLQ
jgi:hypothetical protein